MSRPQQYSLLLVRGDGSRVLRITLRRRSVAGAAAAALVVASALGALVGDWVSLRQLPRGDRALLGEQRRSLETITRRVAELSREAEAWRALHGRIWEALGPDPPATPPAGGIGGGVRPSPLRAVRGDLDRLAEIVAEEGENLRALDRLMARVGRALAALPSQWPVRGPVNSEFGRRPSPWAPGSEFHGGIDIGAPNGTAVYSAAAGMVVTAGPLGDRGLTVTIDHGQEVRTQYAHLSRISVNPGQSIARGALIGFTGNTGRSTGPHLHYEIVVHGQPVNPRAFLWE